MQQRSVVRICLIEELHDALGRGVGCAGFAQTRVVLRPWMNQ
jgi:hypothetical protein